MSVLLRFLRIAIAAVALVSANARADIDGEPRRGADLFEAKGCVACHGSDGLSVTATAPHLAGQQRTYLFNQLVNFRTGRASGRLGYKVSERHHPTMSATAAQLRDSDIADIVAYLNRLPCSPGTGIAVPSRPAIATKCDFCHGTNGNSPFVAIPIITGQRQSYIVRQLEEFRDSALDFWGDNARTHRLVLAAKMDLTDTEIAAAARYYTQLSCR